MAAKWVFLNRKQLEKPGLYEGSFYLKEAGETGLSSSTVTVAEEGDSVAESIKVGFWGRTFVVRVNIDFIVHVIVRNCKSGTASYTEAGRHPVKNPNDLTPVNTRYHSQRTNLIIEGNRLKPEILFLKALFMRTTRTTSSELNTTSCSLIYYIYEQYPRITIVPPERSSDRRTYPPSPPPCSPLTRSVRRSIPTKFPRAPLWRFNPSNRRYV